MKTPANVRELCVTAALLLATVGTIQLFVSCAAQQTENLPLQITIRQTSPQLTFQVELHNTGKETLNLDHPLENSADYYTLGLQFIDQQDKKRWLAQKKSGCDERVTKCYYVGILQAGYPALLQPGETYSFSVDLRNFNLPHTPGRYTLQAIYTHDFSEPAVFPSRVTSNSVPFTISAP